jgi:hypothetical protein
MLSFNACRTTRSAGQNDGDGFVRIFDGATLNNWVGDSTYWKRNTFIILQGGGTRQPHENYINGVLMSDVTDNDTVNRRFTGFLAVQVHVGPPMRIAYRNFRLKRLK